MSIKLTTEEHNSNQVDTLILSRNLDMLMQEHKLSANQLAKLVGIPATSIKRIRTNVQHNPTLSTLLPIAKYFRITLAQLIGEEPLKKTDEANSQLLARNQRQLPLLSLKEVTLWFLDQANTKETIETSTSCSSKAFAVKIEESNNLKFSKGTILIVDLKNIINNGDYILVSKDGTEQAVIKLALIEDGEIYVKSLIIDTNPAKLNEYHYLGTIIQSIFNF